MNDSRPELEASTSARALGARPSTYTLALNLLPLLHLAGGVVAVLATEGGLARTLLALGWIYLLPPAVARLARAIGGGSEGIDLTQECRAYKVWWLETQLQLLFNRLPVLEEFLRFVPGLYALWLRLWGSRVSAKVYWAAGALVTDRGLLDIGDVVVVGTRAVLAAHLGYKNEGGEFRVTVARIRIEDEVLVGAYAGIGPGCRIERGAEVPTAAFLRPATVWAPSGRRRTDRPRMRA